MVLWSSPVRFLIVFSYVTMVAPISWLWSQWSFGPPGRFGHPPLVVTNALVLPIALVTPLFDGPPDRFGDPSVVTLASALVLPTALVSQPP